MKYTLKNKEIELYQEELKEIIKLNKEKEVKKEEIKFEITSIFGDVIFTSYKYNNIKEALEEAVKENVNLRNADLKYADLRYADLRYADLENANLRNANLGNANLENANLNNADLMNSRFYGQGGNQKLTKEQVPVFLKALGFIIKE